MQIFVRYQCLKLGTNHGRTMIYVVKVSLVHVITQVAYLQKTPFNIPNSVLNWILLMDDCLPAINMASKIVYLIVY